MQEKRTPEMDREEIYAVLKRHEGSQTEVAEALGVTLQSVSDWLNGKMTSRNIAAACASKAEKLVEYEAKLKKHGLEERP